MSRSANGSSLYVLILSVLLLFVGVRPSPATNFTYETAKVDPNDLSFYQPPMTAEPYPLTSATKVRNVIFCIGDGMGINTVALAGTKVGGPGGKLHIERLPITGLMRTYSANSRVTDSAAAGTALACGVKTKNGMIGMTPEETGYITILEAAQAKGMATGLVVTCTMSHATPASFGSHVKSRKLEPAIAEQLVANRINILLGGGRKYFLPQSDPNSGRKDNVDVLAQAQEVGYTYVDALAGLRAARGSHVLGLFQFDALKTAGPEPTLAQMTQQAIRLLRQASRESNRTKSGFFLMVEGSQIDWECHSNKVNGAIRQTLLFDQAVEAAVDFALKDGHTLVIVTADHETGGVTLIGGGDEDKPDPELGVRWSTKGHSGGPVAIWALGPGAARFSGVQENTDIPRKIAQLLGIRPFPRPLK
ncbi:MAG TPA: alkaline phosphatase [Sedimentisphaerales bacterium]|jgi:alkaline phosphatase|nr:alkaline phosphatase [Sedimentisphaerales bacterium]HNU29866.1 alkaline phosphatase [Sedimentisphaerales bacterium]